jgi:hypothetical protein
MNGAFAMPKPKPRARGLNASHESDIGPLMLHRRGWLTLEDAPDPDAPNRTIRRARAVWVPDEWLRKGTITQAHHNAAVRYHEAYALGVMGASDRAPIYIQITGAPSGLSDARLAAVTDYRKASDAVGAFSADCLTWCVLNRSTVANWANNRRMHPQIAAGYLLAAIHRLTEHYRLT